MGEAAATAGPVVPTTVHQVTITVRAAVLAVTNVRAVKPHIATRCPQLLRLTRAHPRTTPLRWARAYSTSSASGTATATSTNMVVQLTVVAGPSTNTEIRALGPMAAR